MKSFLFTSIEVPNIVDDAKGRVIWLNKKGEEADFSAKAATNVLCIDSPKVSWWRLIWYSQCVPKQSFILWLAIQDRLSTQDKLVKWGMHTVNRCALCKCDNEDLQHLFFKCAYSAEVWDKAKNMADITYENCEWYGLIMRLANDCINKNIGWIVRRLVFAACVYFLWQERNGRIFRDNQNSSQEIYNKVVENVKYRLAGITVKDSSNVRKVEDKWMVKCKRIGGEYGKGK